MAGDRTLNWGADQTDARYQQEDTGDGADFILVRDLNNSLVPLRYDGTANELVADVGDLTVTDVNEPYPTTASASGTTTIDLSQGNHHRVEAINNITIEFTNVSANTNSVTLYIVDSDGAGPYTITWPTNTIWAGGNVTTEVAANSNVEVGLITGNGGAVDPEWRARATEGYA